MTIDCYCSVGVDREYDLTAEALVQSMDAAEVERAVIAPVDRCLAVHNRDGNDAMLQAAAQHPNRLIAACSVNPWYGAAALEELHRALRVGRKSARTSSILQGFLANDELSFPLLEAAATEQVPVYIHTGTPGSATPWQIGDLAERFPETDLIMGHCGGTDFWNDAASAASSFSNVYIESSLARPFQFVNHVEKLDAGKGMLGSWAPLNDLEFEWEQMRRYVPAALWAAIAGGNLMRLLEKRGPV